MTSNSRKNSVQFLTLNLPSFTINKNLRSIHTLKFLSLNLHKAPNAQHRTTDTSFSETHRSPVGTKAKARRSQTTHRGLNIFGKLWQCQSTQYKQGKLVKGWASKYLYLFLGRWESCLNNFLFLHLPTGFCKLLIRTNYLAEPVPSLRL